METNCSNLGLPPLQESMKYKVNDFVQLILKDLHIDKKIYHIIFDKLSADAKQSLTEGDHQIANQDEWELMTNDEQEQVLEKLEIVEIKEQIKNLIGKEAFKI